MNRREGPSPAGGRRGRPDAPRIRVVMGLVLVLGVGLLAGIALPGLLSEGGAPDAASAHTRAVGSEAGGPELHGASLAPEAPGAAAGRLAGSPRQDAAPARRTAIVEAAERVRRSVVSIRVVRPGGRPQDVFGFPSPFARDRLVPGLGSGFAIDTLGHVLTNHHVVQGAREIQVADSRGRVYDAELVGSDELTDVALLRIDPPGVPPAPLGTSSDLMVGEPALAMGNPFGFQLADTEATVTVGVISGVSRDIRSGGQRGVLYADMIQTDASINPGNSGGPLVNALGEVVGVNSSILSESGGSEGIGFAIPVDRALRVAEELRRHGRVRQAWVGADVAAVPSDTLLSRTVVRRVAPGSPADAAGLAEGDVLLSVGGRPVDGPMDWEVALLDAGVGSRVSVAFLRGGERHTGSMEVQQPPSERAERVRVLQGLELVSVTRQIATERDLQVTRGALIVDVTAEVARATRMTPGDVIVAINRRRVDDAADAAELFREATRTGRVQVFLYRDGSQVVTSFAVR